METPPLLVALQLDEASFAWLDALRRAHFPAERNFLAAHLTLFHKLPPEEAPAIEAALAHTAAATPPLPLEFAGYRFLGRGVAASYRCEGLLAARASLAAAFSPWLTPQDKQKFQPHVTVQNKVEPAAAKALHAELEACIPGRAATGAGFLLWRYLGGPWELIRVFPFSGQAHDK